MVAFHAAVIVLALGGADARQTVMLDFYADWCGPCRSMDSTVHELAAQGYPVRRVNIDRERDLAVRFHIESIPCFVMIVDGREVARVVGPRPLADLQRMCNLGRRAPAPTSPVMLAGLAAPRPGAGSTAGAVAGPMSHVPVVPVSWPSPPTSASASDATLLAASVRLRVEDAEGHSCGSGTIVDARPGGEALVLTCGHLFRDSKGTGRIDVDLFGPAAATHVPGRLLSYDLKRDVALVAFRPSTPVTVARVAPPSYSVRVGDPVASVGCNNGDDPTVQHSRVNSLDRFLGPPNLQVAGQPIVGRSGGGLFSADGFVIGVCNAADPADREGLFAALGSIHAEMDEQNLASVYRQQPAAPVASPTEAPRTAVAAIDPFERGQTPSASGIAARDPDSVAARPQAEASAAAPLPAGEQIALDEIHRRTKEGAEVVCIIRDRTNPESKSQVITLDHASPDFVKRLAAEGRAQVETHETSLAIATPRTPLLEWSAETGWRHCEPLPSAK